MVWMTLFHLTFDLNLFGLIPRQNFYADPLWTLQRTCIVSLFLGCAGYGQALAIRQGVSGARFWKRWGQVALCAALVSLGSAWMFPKSWISFGVLHGMAVMLLFTRILGTPWMAWQERRPVAAMGALLALAGVALLLPWAGWSHPVFDSRWTNGVGLVTHKPITEDYVPVLPWWGVMLLGFAWGAGSSGRRTVTAPVLSPDAAEAPSATSIAPRHRTLSPPLSGLVWLGRHSLSYYMLHQPVLIALIQAGLWLQRA